MKNSSLTFERYKKQLLLEEIGEEGQKMLKNSSVVIVGCGGLGSIISNCLVRAGIGKVAIVDNDCIELENLHRQMLFDEGDVKGGLPKSVAAAEKLRKINSQVQIEPIVAKVTPENIEGILKGVDLVLDGTDNFDVRFLINDACIKAGIPWIYGGVLATHGVSLTIIPGETPCLRCLIPELQPAVDIPTCDSVGVLGMVITAIASIEATEGIKLLIGKKDKLLRKLISFDIWSGTYQLFEIEKAMDCPACGKGRFDYLNKKNLKSS
ncbi:MAG: ThiF family adenylyltransferase [Candidatus Aminicenantes bacterium]|nr:ThiF family adenylyltransferase [Candidatus Aminicenantes bacterium]